MGKRPYQIVLRGYLKNDNNYTQKQKSDFLEGFNRDNHKNEAAEKASFGELMSNGLIPVKIVMPRKFISRLEKDRDRNEEDNFKEDIRKYLKNKTKTKTYWVELVLDEHPNGGPGNPEGSEIIDGFGLIDDQVVTKEEFNAVYFNEES